jgi:hypothetical protein
VCVCVCVSVSVSVSVCVCVCVCVCVSVSVCATHTSHFVLVCRYAREFKDLALAFGFKEVCLMRSEKE